MKKGELTRRVDANMGETHDALQLVVDELNQGQRKKLVKNPAVKALLERYGVEI